MEGGGDVLLPPGFRFYPAEEELISFYLKSKISGNITQNFHHVIPQLDIYDFSPWDLPKHAGVLCQGDPEQWFFFVPRQDKEERGGKPCRLTNLGYWKATGSPAIVYTSGKRGIGIRRTMVFYSGRLPTGKKTEWKMNEYKVFQEGVSSEGSSPNPKVMQELSLCRVYVKSKTLGTFERRPLLGEATGGEPHQNEDHRAAISDHLSRDDNGLNFLLSNSSENNGDSLSTSAMGIDYQP